MFERVLLQYLCIRKLGLVRRKFRALDSTIGHQGDRTWHRDTEKNFAPKRFAFIDAHKKVYPVESG